MRSVGNWSIQPQNGHVITVSLWTESVVRMQVHFGHNSFLHWQRFCFALKRIFAQVNLDANGNFPRFGIVADTMASSDDMLSANQGPSASRFLIQNQSLPWIDSESGTVPANDPAATNPNLGMKSFWFLASKFNRRINTFVNHMQGHF